MATERTLLAYLTPRLTNRGEDTATDALAFILNKSSACRGALDLFLRDEELDLEPIARVQTQVTYEDGSRPDMVGYDQSGHKRLLVESKFWATLLQGQASGYFSQLEEAGPGVLLFIAPDTRIETLWAEIQRQMESVEDKVRLEPIESPRSVRKARVGSDKRVILVSWVLLLGHLAASVPSDSPVASDIQQLRGLAQREDDDAFQPIHSEEFGPSLARRIRWLNRLIDDVVDGHGVKQGWMSVSGLRATPQRAGYGRYFRFTGAPGDLFLGVNYNLWATRADTPLWLRINENVPVNPEKLRDMAPSLVEMEGLRRYYFPIYLKTGVEYEAVLNDVVSHVQGVADTLDNAGLSQREANHDYQQNRRSSPHGEPLDPIIERTDGTILFPDGSEGRPGQLTEDQQRQMDFQRACRLSGQTGDYSELQALGIWPAADDGDEN